MNYSFPQSRNSSTKLAYKTTSLFPDCLRNQKMDVLSPIAGSPEFHFNSTAFSSHTTAPSSPTPFGGDPFIYDYHYTSAPSSPTRAAAIYSQFAAWENPTPSSHPLNDNSGDVFDFVFSPRRNHQPVGYWSPEIATADKLFNNGRIRPLQENGRNLLGNPSRNRQSRSLSPPRDEKLVTKNASPPVKSSSNKKWPKLKDLLLFRSASEGRVTGRGSRDPLRKYTVLPSVSSVNKKRTAEDKKAGEGVGRSEEERKRKMITGRGSGPAVSPHEKHYTANRAAAEERKRKTPLPFQRQGLLSFIHFSPALRGKNKGVSAFSRGGI